MQQLNIPAYALLRDRIREEIISGKIKGDTRLTIEDISKRYNVSHQPVREAFQWLKGEGLISILPHKGARTRNIDEKLVGNIYDIRSAIEGLMVRLCIGNLTSSLMDRLSEIHEQLKKAVEKQQISDVVRIDNIFHSTIYELADNPEALEIYDRYASLLFALRKKYGFGHDRYHWLINDHEKILQAMKNRDPDEAERLVRVHSQGAKKDLINKLKGGQDEDK